MQDMNSTVVVLADDHELHAAIKNSLFQRAGFVTYDVNGAEDTFLAIRRLRPVLVILTLDMAGESGDLICRRIKEDADLHSTPVALIAHYEDNDERERCRESGCDEVLHRPLSTKQLMAATYRMLKVFADRYEFRGFVQFEGLCGGDGESLRDCSILNLSGSGAFIETGKLRPVDSSIILEFSLPDDDEAVRCRGRVAWLNHPEWSRKPHLPVGFGVQFESLPPEKRAHIEEFIHSGKH
ncbi:MAG: hypothetical protein C0623_10200 [Desulfuromonas sp.]|nr:MAG: hypothetical protein C0623_10200 [Desulfuromonas sp.]